MNAKIKFLTTGGTIDKVYFDAKSEFQVGPPQVTELLQHANVTFAYEVESILRKDSLDLTDADRALIRERVLADPAERIVVTHGTDTMILTARALRGIEGKTIVLTGSMRGADLAARRLSGHERADIQPRHQPEECGRAPV